MNEKEKERAGMPVEIEGPDLTSDEYGKFLDILKGMFPGKWERIQIGIERGLVVEDIVNELPDLQDSTEEYEEEKEEREHRDGMNIDPVRLLKEALARQKKPHRKRR